MKITVKKDMWLDAPKRWLVMDGDLVYDRYSTEQEARAEAHKLIEEQRINDAIEEQLDNMIVVISQHFALDRAEAKKRLKQVAEGL